MTTLLVRIGGLATPSQYCGGLSEATRAAFAAGAVRQNVARKDVEVDIKPTVDPFIVYTGENCRAVEAAWSAPQDDETESEDEGGDNDNMNDDDDDDDDGPGVCN